MCEPLTCLAYRYVDCCHHAKNLCRSYFWQIHCCLKIKQVCFIAKNLQRTAF